MAEFITEKVERSYTIDIWIAGTRLIHKEVIQEYCNSVGLCVTVTDTDFIYTGGSEIGVRIGLRQYPRYPQSETAIMAHAQRLGWLCAKAAKQTSYMIEEVGGQAITYWFSKRKP